MRVWSRVRQLLAVVSILAVLPVGSPALSQDNTAADRLAQQLLFDIPRDRKIALRLFSSAETGLSADVSDPLYDQLYTALFRISNARHQFVERKNLLKLLNSRREFYTDNPEELLKAARAEVEIICALSPAGARGLRLSCSAADLETALTLSRAQEVLRLPAGADTALPLVAALDQLAVRLIPAMQDMKSLAHPVILDQAQGVQTDLGALLADELMGRLPSGIRTAQEAAAKEYARQSALNDSSTVPPSIDRHYRITGTIWQLDRASLQLTVKALRDDGHVEGATTRITLNSLPEGVAVGLPLGGDFYQATASAHPGPRLDRESALRGARNLARARIVAQALGLQPPAITSIRSESDAAHVLSRALVHGIPVAERFSNPAAGAISAGLAVRLEARVLPVGHVFRPAVTARLSQSVFRAREPIHIQLEADATAYLGIFAWGADNRIVRLYPNRDTPVLTVNAGDRRILPEPAEGQLMSLPLPVPGNFEDHEAIIVVSAASDYPFEELANQAGQTLDATQAAARPATRFFNALARFDLSRMSVQVLPYQVTR